MISEVAFAALVWGAVVVVLAVFVYELYAVAADAGWLDGSGTPGPDR